MIALTNFFWTTEPYPTLVPIIMRWGFLVSPEMPDQRHRLDLLMTPLTPIIETTPVVISVNKMWRWTATLRRPMRAVI